MYVHIYIKPPITSTTNGTTTVTTTITTTNTTSITTTIYHIHASLFKVFNSLTQLQTLMPLYVASKRTKVNKTLMLLCLNKPCAKATSARVKQDAKDFKEPRLKF